MAQIIISSSLHLALSLFIFFPPTMEKKGKRQFNVFDDGGMQGRWIQNWERECYTGLARKDAILCKERTTQHVFHGRVT